MHISLAEKINLSTDWINVDVIQGGNRVGTLKNPQVKKGDTGTVELKLYSASSPKSFMTDSHARNLAKPTNWEEA